MCCKASYSSDSMDDVRAHSDTNQQSSSSTECVIQKTAFDPKLSSPHLPPTGTGFPGIIYVIGVAGALFGTRAFNFGYEAILVPLANVLLHRTDHIVKTPPV